MDRRLELIVEVLLHELPIDANEDGVLRRRREGA